MSSLKIILSVLGAFIAASIFIYKAAYDAGQEQCKAEIRASILGNKKEQEAALAKLPVSQKDYFKCVKNGQCSL